MEIKMRPSSASGFEKKNRPNFGFGGSRPRNCLINFDKIQMNLEKKKLDIEKYDVKPKKKIFNKSMHRHSRSAFGFENCD